MKVFPFNSKTTPWRIDIPARFSPDRKRKAQYFATKEEAQKFLVNFKKFGPATFADRKFAIGKTETDQMTVVINDCIAKLGNDRALFYQAVDHFQKTRLNVKKATVREVLEAFQEWRAYQVKVDKLSTSTLDADRWRLNKLIDPFGAVHLVDLTPVALREFFDGITGDPRSVYKSVRVFFGWAHERGYLGENPMATVKPVGEFGINNEYYPVKTFKRMLLIAAGLEPVRSGATSTRDFIDLLPWFVLSGFLGLRSCEAYRLNRNAEAIRWTDLHWDAEVPNVEVREEVAKETARDTNLRHIETPHYLAAAKAWLDYLGPQPGPFIVRWTKRQIQELKREFTKATKIKFIENGLRNSFATYALTYNGLQGVGKLALEMGNSEDICKRHYIKNIAPGSGRAWFNLRPFEIVSSEAAMATVSVS